MLGMERNHQGVLDIKCLSDGGDSHAVAARNKDDHTQADTNTKRRCALILKYQAFGSIRDYYRQD